MTADRCMIQICRRETGKVETSKLDESVCKAMEWIDRRFNERPDHPWTYVLTWGDQRKEIIKASDLLQRGRYDDWD